MKPWSGRQFLFSGLALIALTNAVALGGVAWNRSGEPESRLTLGMRDLRVSRGDFSRESSGLMLKLVWRTPAQTDEGAGAWNMYGGGGMPPWLDGAKMAELGFELPNAETDTALPRHRGTSREVLLVLELDGPAWQAQLELVRRETDRRIAKAAELPDDKQAKRDIDEARQWRQREENELSRLFVVDAGLDAQALRQRYPDRAHYAIVRGRIAPTFERKDKRMTVRGYVQAVLTDTLNVPYAYRSELAAADADGRSPRDQAREALKGAEVTIAFGRRLEPWIVAIDRPAGP